MTTLIACLACLFVGAAAGILLMSLMVAHRLGPREFTLETRSPKEGVDA